MLVEGISIDVILPVSNVFKCYNNAKLTKLNSNTIF